MDETYTQRKYDLGKDGIYSPFNILLNNCKIVVFGATGFTGELTCEYLIEIKDKVLIMIKKSHHFMLLTRAFVGFKMGYCWSFASKTRECEGTFG
jgi:hypothetical protein